MKKVLVTGAAGGMGYETLKQMVEDGCDYKIVALDLPNDNTKMKENWLTHAMLIGM